MFVTRPLSPRNLVSLVLLCVVITSVIWADLRDPCARRSWIPARPADESKAVEPCRGAVYVYAPEMPLSLAGKNRAQSAATGLGLAFMAVEADSLYRHTSSDEEKTDLTRLFDQVVAAGAGIHYPSLVLVEDGRVLGPAITGFKSEDAYREAIAASLDGTVSGSKSQLSRRMRIPAATAVRQLSLPDGTGFYMRVVPGKGMVSLAANGRNLLLDLNSGDWGWAPGELDLIPSPDGKLMVTPDRKMGGLRFFDARHVTLSGGPEVSGLSEIHVDWSIRDQYPSIGVLHGDQRITSEETAYRVLTGWGQQGRFRDYGITWGADSVSVRPLRKLTVLCENVRFSLPMISPDGQRVVGRDESSGTTKIYEIDSTVRCVEAWDTGLSSGKGAWSPDGDQVVFDVPRQESSRAGIEGLVVFSALDGGMSLLLAEGQPPDLRFPDFVGGDSIVFVSRTGGAHGPRLLSLTTVPFPLADVHDKVEYNWIHRTYCETVCGYSS